MPAFALKIFVIARRQCVGYRPQCLNCYCDFWNGALEYGEVQVHWRQYIYRNKYPKQYQPNSVKHLLVLKLFSSIDP
ncbi:hypothetical protein FGO68_gene6891 [Halteria grandinella]|uniref:Uncharacterized protein n=1 Tax=Halteria grandinella TaxID=5974 RepID=A0A8J8P2N2_HALGN|nr:hypothetical protein FGO68_gene6891 [Halteria grandinella]